LMFKDPNLKARIDLLKNFGIKNEEEVVMPGINGKMNEIQAVIGLEMLDYIEEEINKRKVLVDAYRRCLADVPGLSVLPEPEDATSSYQYFIVRIEQEKFRLSRDEIYEGLKSYNVFTRKYFYPLCSDYTCYRQLPSANPANLPVATLVARQVLSLPLYGELSVDDVERICQMIISLGARTN